MISPSIFIAGKPRQNDRATCGNRRLRASFAPKAAVTTGTVVPSACGRGLP